MPSPFPGMDPYLENPGYFPGVQHDLIVLLSWCLNQQLPKPYYADIQWRLWYEYSAQMVPIDERTDSFVQIRIVEKPHRTVTSIEVLKMDTKTPTCESHTLYLKKQKELLDEQINSVEIDLLRGGTPTTSLPRDEAIASVGPFDYHVCIRTVEESAKLRVHPIQLAERLPTLLIPLLPGEPCCAVDLQSLFDRSYDTGPYHRCKPYNDPPEPPLTPEQAAWVEGLLRDKGLLP